MSSVLLEQANNYAAARARMGSPLPTARQRSKPVVRTVMVRHQDYVPPPPPPPPITILTPQEHSARLIEQVKAEAAKRQITAPPQLARKITKEVAEKHNVSVRDMQSASRFRHIVTARNEAFYRLRNETTLSLPQIGRRFGDRDHTTVLHGIRRYMSEVLGQEWAPKRRDPIWGEGGWH